MFTHTMTTNTMTGSTPGSPRGHSYRSWQYPLLLSSFDYNQPNKAENACPALSQGYLLFFTSVQCSSLDCPFLKEIHLLMDHTHRYQSTSNTR